MNVIGVDPRDQRWEIGTPRYRVYFHDGSGATDEYEITDADVAEVIEFAQQRRGSGPTCSTSASPAMTTAQGCCGCSTPTRTTSMRETPELYGFSEPHDIRGTVLA